MLLRKRDEILVEVEARDVGGRIGGIADHDRQRLGDRMNDRTLDRLEKLRRRLRGDRADYPAGHQKTKRVNRIARIRHQHDIAAAVAGPYEPGPQRVGAVGRGQEAAQLSQQLEREGRALGGHRARAGGHHPQLAQTQRHGVSLGDGRLVDGERADGDRAGDQQAHHDQEHGPIP